MTVPVVNLPESDRGGGGGGAAVEWLEIPSYLDDELQAEMSALSKPSANR